MSRRSNPPLWWQVFIAEYLKNGQNGKRAYMAARPKTTERSAETRAGQVLRNVEFKKLLEQAQAKIVQKLEMSSEQWFEEVCGIATTKKVKVNAAAKIKALEMVGKYKNYIKDKVEHSGVVEIAVVDPYAVEQQKPGKKP